jgi:hypothetical protein
MNNFYKAKEERNNLILNQTRSIFKIAKGASGDYKLLTQSPSFVFNNGSGDKSPFQRKNSLNDSKKDIMSDNKVKHSFYSNTPTRKPLIFIKNETSGVPSAQGYAGKIHDLYFKKDERASTPKGGLSADNNIKRIRYKSNDNVLQRSDSLKNVIILFYVIEYE